MPLLWNSFYLHLAYLAFIYSICIWNGGSYYIEVFSKAYRTQFEGDAVRPPPAATIHHLLPSGSPRRNLRTRLTPCHCHCRSVPLSPKGYNLFVSFCVTPLCPTLIW